MKKFTLLVSALSLLSASALFNHATAGESTPSREHIAWQNIQQGALVIDARTAKEYAQGHIDGAVNIPFDIAVKQFSALGIAKDRQVVLYCRSGNRSGKALASLKKAGYTNLHNGGGFKGMMETIK
jgi:phage shock protein E